MRCGTTSPKSTSYQRRRSAFSHSYDAGYLNSFGHWKAVALSTGLFLLMHISELIYFYPAALGITAAALGALYMRLRASAIGPAIAVHVAYNTLVVVLAVASSFIHPT
jgi:membrane protease YdiL (CAAX protease family)